MKLKKLVTLTMVGIISTSILTGCKSSSEGAESGEDKLTVAMITDVAGVNDQSYNQSAWEGLQRAEKELGVKIKYLESKQDSDYTTNLETLADEEVDLIIGVGSKLGPTIEEGAKNYPEQKFAIIDETYEEIPSNVKSVLFDAEQSSYLVGLIAGKMSETKNVGFIGGLDIPVINTFKYGYMAGVKAADKSCEIQTQYANSFTDQAKGKAIASQMMSKSADTIFIAGGDVGTGAMEAIKEAGKYGIGVDRDQSDLAPKNVLTSAIKRVDVGMYETIKELVDGKFQGGISATYGLKENGIGIADTTSNLVPQDIMELVNKQVEKLKAGEISVPKTEEEYNKFIKSL
ncbi:BMP family lipoprotein [Terrisporobacter sp.]